MATLEVIGVLEEAAAENAEFVFVLVKTRSTDEMIVLTPDRYEEKKEFYEEHFDENGSHKTYPGIALLAASHGDAYEGVRLRKAYYGIAEDEQPLLPPEETEPEDED